MSEQERELPRYICHKVVWALKIAAIVENGETGSDLSGEITPVEAGFPSFRVDGYYLRKHNPRVGGYYVRYFGGYESFSPAEVFEAGYTAE